LPLVVGLGVAHGLDALGIHTKLKWPNDLLCTDGRKVAGVLLEGLSEGWLINWIIAGVGVNVRSAPDPARSASVDELFGRAVPLAEVAAAVLDGIAGTYLRWQSDGFAPFAAEYERRSYLAGRPVRVSDAAGRIVAAGEALLAPSVTKRLIEEFATRPDPHRTPAAALAALTEREREVLALVARGLSNAEIATELFISPATAKTHVSRVMTKLGARDRAQLVVTAYEAGLVVPRSS